MATDRVAELCLAYGEAIDSGDAAKAFEIEQQLTPLLRFRYATTYENGITVGMWVYFLSIKGGIERVPIPKGS